MRWNSFIQLTVTFLVIKLTEVTNGSATFPVGRCIRTHAVTFCGLYDDHGNHAWNEEGERTVAG